MNVRELLKKYPDKFVIRAKIWTPTRGTIESKGAHDPVIGLLVTLLLCRDEPRTPEELKAMQDLTELIRGTSSP